MESSLDGMRAEASPEQGLVASLAAQRAWEPVEGWQRPSVASLAALMAWAHMGRRRRPSLLELEPLDGQPAMVAIPWVAQRRHERMLEVSTTPQLTPAQRVHVLCDGGPEAHKLPWRLEWR